MLHGLDGNRASPSVGLVDLAAGLHGNGFSVLLFDLRGHGGSSAGQLSGGLFEQEDVLGGYDWLVGRGLPPGKIGLLGVSMGSSTSLLAAAREQGIAGVVGDSSFAEITDMIASEIPKRTSLPSWLGLMFVPGMSLAAPVFYDVDLSRIAAEKVIGNLNYPVFLVHCVGDERIPQEHSQRLHEAAPDSVLWIAPCTEHVKAFKSYPDEYSRRISQYFNERFSVAKSSPRALSPGYAVWSWDSGAVLPSCTRWSSSPERPGLQLNPVKR